MEKKPDIKIFVSHRIDLDSETIDNPLYVNVRCGAVYDKRDNVEMLGDDTGDNISEKRNSYCELTVQYWAWKNVEADYYGLCHYRRYLSFATNTSLMLRNEKNHINEKLFNPIKHRLTDCNYIKNLVSKYDAIVPENDCVNAIKTPRGYKNTVREYWESYYNFIIPQDTLEYILMWTKEYDICLYNSAMEYLSNKHMIGFNTYIMKKELFKKLCEYEYYILSKIDELVDYTYASDKYMMRAVGFVSEILFGIYVYHISKKEYSIKRLPIVFFEETEKHTNILKLDNNSIPIILMSSDYYVPYISVLLRSLMNCCDTNKKYDVIILNNDIKEENKKILKKMINPFDNISLRFYDPSHMISKEKLYVSNPVYSETAYYRIISPWIFSDYDKAIVLDADIILKSDISSIMDEEIENNFIGAVKDVLWQGMINSCFTDMKEYATNDMNLLNPYNYVNTGVLVMNFNLIRESFKLEYIVDIMTEKKFRFQEQDLMNIIFEGNVKFLDQKYNYIVDMGENNKLVLEYTPNISIKERENAFCNAVVIHYAGQPKPWDYPEVKLASDFWEIARNTPFYEIMIKRLMDNTVNKRMMYTTLGSNDDWIFQHMGGNLYSRFVFPWKAVKPGAKIVMYGGGIVGKTFLRQLANHPYCHIVTVVDQNPATTGIVECPVIDINGLAEINPKDYDMVLIAMEKKDIAIAIRADLELMGIPPHKIKWVDPARK